MAPSTASLLTVSTSLISGVAKVVWRRSDGTQDLRGGPEDGHYRSLAIPEELRILTFDERHVDLELIEKKVYDSGVVLLSYRVQEVQRQ